MINETETLTSETTAQIERLTREAVDRPPVKLDDDQYHLAIVPHGYRASLVEVTRPKTLDAQPDRRRGTTTHQSAASLASYVGEHHDAATTTVWVDVPQVGLGQVVAVIDDHHAAGPLWGEHRAVLPLRTTTEWDYWMSRHDQMVGHLEFVEHLEGGLGEISDPPAGQLLDLIREIESTRDVAFSSAVRQGGLNNITYRETEDATVTNRGEVKLPSSFALTLAVFPGSTQIEVEVRVRFRLAGGTLRIGYTIDRPASVIERATKQLVEELEQALPESVRGRVYRGVPVDTGDREPAAAYASSEDISAS